MLPNLFIIGAAKSGTTTLYELLKSQKGIAGSRIKEPHYFSRVRITSTNSDEVGNGNHTYVIKTLKEYLDLFKSTSTTKYLVEASPSYLWDVSSAQKIYSFNSKAKIIIILRDPIERAYSHYLNDISANRQYEFDFITAVNNDLKAENREYGYNHLYIDLGLYYNSVKEYLNIFGFDNVLILFYEDLSKKREALIDSLNNFLKLSFNDINLVRKANKTIYPKYPWLNKIRRLNLTLTIKRNIPKWVITRIKNRTFISNDSVISDEARSFLTKYFSQDINNLESLIGKDCGSLKKNFKWAK